MLKYCRRMKILKRERSTLLYVINAQIISGQTYERQYVGNICIPVCVSNLKKMYYFNYVCHNYSLLLLASVFSLLKILTKCCQNFISPCGRWFCLPMKIIGRINAVTQHL